MALSGARGGRGFAAPQARRTSGFQGAEFDRLWAERGVFGLTIPFASGSNPRTDCRIGGPRPGIRLCSGRFPMSWAGLRPPPPALALSRGANYRHFWRSSASKMSDDEVLYLVGAGSADPHPRTVFKRGDITAFAVAFEVCDRVYGDDGGAVDAQEATRIEPSF